MPDPTVEAQLATVPLLVDLGAERIRALAALGAPRRFSAGERLFEQGDRGDALFILTAGGVRVSAGSSAGDEVTLALLGPGEALGELSVLDGAPRSGSAIAVVATDAIVIARDRFQSWLAADPGAAAALLRTLSRRLRAANEAFADAAFLDISHRLAKRLLALRADARTSHLRVTQQELASGLGVTRESVNKTLRQFQARGWVSLGRGQVTLLDATGLEGAAVAG